MSEFPRALPSAGLSAEPTEIHSWTATSGHKIEAKALQLKKGQVQLEKTDGTKIVVPLAKLSDEDQKLLRTHFPTDDSGFSGGSRMAFSTSQKHKDIAGVIACGAGGDTGSSKQTVYGLCGSNCFNRTDMANSFKSFKNKDNVLRYFSGMHDWANAELCDDAITHLNGVFLFTNREKYPAECAFYQQQIGALIAECQQNSPLRAYMWTSFLIGLGVADPPVTASEAALAKDPISKLYLKGLTDVSRFAEKTFGAIPGSQWQSDPKVAAACKREAAKIRRHSVGGNPHQDGGGCTEILTAVRP